MSNEKTEETAETEEKPKTDLQFHRFTDDELRTFIDDFLSGRVWTSVHTPDNLLTSVFLPIAFGGFASYTDSSLENIGVLYEHMAKAGPRSVNGCPMFLSMQFMHKDDWERAAKAIDRERERRKAIEV